MGEDFPYKEEVIGLNPIPSTICGCSSIGRALRCQRKGCGIVPHHPLQYAALVDHLAQLPSKQQNRGKHSDAAPLKILKCGFFKNYAKNRLSTYIYYLYIEL